MKRTGRWLAMGSVGLVLLAACADQPASAAATVGDARIEMQEVSDQLLSINDVLGEPADAAEIGRTNDILRNNVVYELVDQTAAAAGVTVTQTAVDQRLADTVEFVGSRELLEEDAARAGVAPDMIEVEIRVSLLAEEIAEDLAGGVPLSPDDQQALLIAEVQRYSDEAGTVINPRFGWWDVASLSIVEDPEAPSAQPELDLIGFP